MLIFCFPKFKNHSKFIFLFPNLKQFELVKLRFSVSKAFFDTKWKFLKLEILFSNWMFYCLSLCQSMIIFRFSKFKNHFKFIFLVPNFNNLEIVKLRFSVWKSFFDTSWHTIEFEILFWNWNFQCLSICQSMIIFCFRKLKNHSKSIFLISNFKF